MKKLKVLVVFDSAGTPPEDQDFSEEFKKEEWFTEAAVIETLELMGHDVKTLGIYDDIELLISAIKKNRPDVVFNLTEVFMGKAHLDKNIPALLDLMAVPYTGCAPEGLILCNNKALSKKILTYHRIKVPQFHSFRKGKRIWLPAKLRFPLIIKPLREEASTGISQASYVVNEEQFRERIGFIHNKLNMNAIAEEYIEGRELYVGIMGHKRLQAFPIREMKFTKVPDNEPKIATYNAKWDQAYRQRWGIINGFANIPADINKKILTTCKKAYRVLNIDGYARFDCRLTDDNKIYILEANGNPELAQGDEFAESADKAGIPYNKLLQQILNLALTKK
ncbi:ATP-grasp domain-containing protein [Verrucomicrobiota bacterium]